MSEDAPQVGGTDQCPVCGRDPGVKSARANPEEAACTNDDCPVRLWDVTTPLIEFDCKDCGKHVKRPRHQMDVAGLTPKRCASCTFERMAEP